MRWTYVLRFGIPSRWDSSVDVLMWIEFENLIMRQFENENTVVLKAFSNFQIKNCHISSCEG